MNMLFHLEGKPNSVDDVQDNEGRKGRSRCLHGVRDNLKDGAWLLREKGNF